ncbi:hypothetical protein SLA2020_050140 [Shorea laevis]
MVSGLISVERHGVEGVGGIPTLHFVHNIEPIPEPRGIRCKFRPIQVVASSNREFKLRDPEDVGERNGGKAKGDIFRLHQIDGSLIEVGDCLWPVT